MTEFTCPRCHRASTNPMDAIEGYCGHCHDWTDPTQLHGHLRPMHYDIEGNAIPPSRWAELHEAKHSQGYGRIGNDTIGLYWVSTVWLGLNHNWTDNGPPLIFETMVFLEGTVEDAGPTYRYATKEEALAGHEAVCAEIRELERAVEHDPADGS